MLPELAQWITPAILVVGFLYALRSMKQMESRLETRMERLESRLSGRIDGLESRIGDLRNHVDTQISDLRDRMGSQNSALADRLERIEGYLDLLQQFFIRDGRGSAA